MKTLISTACLILCLMALVTGVAAQAQLNFSNLPLMSTPSLMPNGYGGLSWGNFFYVDPFDWAGAGPGYRLGTNNGDVAFIGGLFCLLQANSCIGVLSNPGGFELVSAEVAGGYSPAAVTATAYNNGTYIGRMNFFVGTSKQAVNFPSSWGMVTEVQFRVTGQTDDLVFYNVSLYQVIQNPPPGD